MRDSQAPTVSFSSTVGPRLNGNGTKSFKKCVNRVSWYIFTDRVFGGVLDDIGRKSAWSTYFLYSLGG
jgi:hypothetical protein